MPADLTISATTQDYDYAQNPSNPDWGRVTYLTVTINNAEIDWGPHTTGYKFNNAFPGDPPFWGHDIDWSELLWQNADYQGKAEVSQAESRTFVQWTGMFPHDEYPSNGIRRPRSVADYLDDGIVATFADNPSIVTVQEGRLFTIDGDTDLDGWIWPAATHVYITNGRGLYFMCLAEPRSVYTMHGHALMQPQPQNAQSGKPPSTIAAVGDPSLGDKTNNQYAGLTWDTSGEWMWSGDRVYHAISEAHIRGSQSAQDNSRSLIYGMPPTGRCYFSAGGFFSSKPADMDAVIEMKFFSAVDSRDQTVEIYRETVTPVNQHSTYWFYEHHNTAIDLSTVTIPTWADYVNIQGKPSVGGDPTNWLRSDAWMPWCPRSHAMALTIPGRSDFLPGIVRQVLP